MSPSSSTDLRDHLQVTGNLVPTLLAGVLAAMLVFGRLTDTIAITVLGAWMPLLLAALWETRGRLLLRSSGPEPVAEPDGTLARWTTTSSLRSTPFVVVWALGCLAASRVYVPRTVLEPSVSPDVGIAVVVAGALLLVSFARYYASTDDEVLPEAPEIASWFRLGAWLFVLVALGLVAVRRGLLPDDRLLVRTVALLGMLPAVEWTLRALRRFRLPALVDEVVYVPLFFSRADPVRSVFDALDAWFGVDLRSTWTLQFVRLALEPLALGLMLLGWVSTSLITIDTFEEGIHERFGAPVSRVPLGPGLHLKAPWPIDVVHTVPTARIRTMPLGYAGAEEGASMLWTRQHAAEEYNLLLGDGRDLVTINALLQYRISDAWTWHYGSQNPADALRAVAERALLRNTVDKSLDDVLSENLGDLARRIEADIVTGIETDELGVTVVSLSMQGLHPPVAVAADYQAVVSAQHEREANILEAKAYETESVKVAEARAIEYRNGAQARSAERTGKARGQSEAFAALEASHRADPVLYRFRKRLEVIERNLDGRAVNIVDDRIERDGGTLWFLR